VEFEVPAERIAQKPSAQRDLCKLLVYRRETGEMIHTIFRHLPDYFLQGDVLVLNQSKVRPARVNAHKITGGRMEILFLEPEEKHQWKVLLKPHVLPGVEVILPDGKRAIVSERLPDGEMRLVCPQTDPAALMKKYGIAPLPPYIKRPPLNKHRNEDLRWYQTVYARKQGSIAAPTAGLHFTQSILERLKNNDIRISYLIHHIGWGTFKPISAQDPKDHRMLPESFEVGSGTASLINRARSHGKRIIGVGTSVTRALESCLTPRGLIRPVRGKTDLFIHPPRPIRSLDGLITNFHLPHSTPLSLIDAFIGGKVRSRIYAEALQKDYRFYSYGDAMLILP
jgi:S-adenosylmethionine:tRNA ribosyltransferase-isomerase